MSPKLYNWKARNRIQEISPKLKFLILLFSRVVFKKGSTILNIHNTIIIAILISIVSPLILISGIIINIVAIVHRVYRYSNFSLLE